MHKEITTSGGALLMNAVVQHPLVTAITVLTLLVTFVNLLIEMNNKIIHRKILKSQQNGKSNSESSADHRHTAS
jgi:hypothetical protein